MQEPLINKRETPRKEAIGAYGVLRRGDYQFNLPIRNFSLNGVFLSEHFNDQRLPHLASLSLFFPNGFSIENISIEFVYEQIQKNPKRLGSAWRLKLLTPKQKEKLTFLLTQDLSNVIFLNRHS